MLRVSTVQAAFIASYYFSEVILREGDGMKNTILM